MNQHLLRRDDGFALPMTIFVVALVTVMLAAVFVRVQADRAIAESSGDLTDALAIAQSGLNTFVGSTTARPGDGDSTRINVVGGFADVVVNQVQRPADTTTNQMFIVRSTGHVITPTQGAVPQAVRTIAQFAQWQTPMISAEAAFTAANGLFDEDGDGEFRGVDACGQPSIHAIRVPEGGKPDLDGYTTTGKDPKVEEDDTPSEVADDTDVDWYATINGGIIADRDTIIDDAALDNDYLVYLIQGDATFGTPGQDTHGTGTLIVTGDLYFVGNRNEWEGLVLVGGRIFFGADPNLIDGLVISGLNEQLGISVPAGSLGDDWTDVDYISCEVESALDAFRGFVFIGNAWMDNWATY